MLIFAENLTSVIVSYGREKRPIKDLEFFDIQKMEINPNYIVIETAHKITHLRTNNVYLIISKGNKATEKAGGRRFDFRYGRDDKDLSSFQLDNVDEVIHYPELVLFKINNGQVFLRSDYIYSMVEPKG